MLESGYSLMSESEKEVEEKAAEPISSPENDREITPDDLAMLKDFFNNR